MRYLALLIFTALLSSCDTSEEDRNFYYNGWMKPERVMANISTEFGRFRIYLISIGTNCFDFPRKTHY